MDKQKLEMIGRQIEITDHCPDHKFIISISTHSGSKIYIIVLIGVLKIEQKCRFYFSVLIKRRQRTFFIELDKLSIYVFRACSFNDCFEIFRIWMFELPLTKIFMHTAIE